jgi:hypothetical protein
MRRVLRSFVIAVAVVLLPCVALAQATLSGIVRDGSGGVLPGVSVEASSPALIEKTRTVLTDGSGQYRIVNLQPGVYALRFSLAGFNTVRREDIELSGSAVVTIPVDLRVGSLQETVTVTAETPVVNVQSAERELVLQNDFVSALPASRSYSALLASIPAIDAAAVVGGGETVSADTTVGNRFFSARGGRFQEGRMAVDGMLVGAPSGGGGISAMAYNTFDATELQVSISGGLGEAEVGGPRMNVVPRSGGNNFAGTAFMNTAGDWSRSENIDDELRTFGITRGPALKQSWDVSGSYGGPIRRDRLWFYGTIRNFGTQRINETGAKPNLLAGDTTQWGYAADESVGESRTVQQRDAYAGRLTAQFGRHRLSFAQDNQYRCDGSSLTPDGPGCRQRGADWVGLGDRVTSPEAHPGYFTNPYYLSQTTWTLPMTSRLLLEGGYSRLAYISGAVGKPPSDGIMDLIPVTEQAAVDGHAANFTYRAINSYRDDWQANNQYRGSMSYVTGAHNVKVGYQGGYQISDTKLVTNSTLIRYRFNRGVPNQFTIQLPDWQTANRTMTHAVYAQDSWTRGRLTMQGALRYDHAQSWHPSSANGTMATSQWNAEPITFERTASVRGYNDISPRLGLAYDLLGTGRTAVKFNAGRYLDAATNDRNYVVNNPANRIQTTMARNWTDNNNNRAVDCNIIDFRAQSPTGAVRSPDTCALVGGNNARFGDLLTGLDEINPAILGGWGVRPYDWQWGAAIQQQLLPRISVEAAYNRRWWGNFTLEDNLALGPADYETWVATAPLDARLPGGGGYTITDYVVRPESAGRPARNYVTFETDFGPARTNYWHGVEFTGQGRLSNGLTFQGGTSTGRTVTDRCETVVKIDSPDPRDCRTVQPFRTSFRASASYTLPKVDVLVSGIARVSPAPEIDANYNFANTLVEAQLGHLPANETANGNQSINLLNANQMYADSRQYQLDMRFAKVLSYRRTRVDFGVDLYNIFNVNTPTSYDGSYDDAPATGLGPGGEWMRPTAIVQPRFARLNLTLRF